MKQHPLSTDIKYLNVPNICFSLTEETDDREPIYFENGLWLYGGKKNNKTYFL